jgi:hypothetical protein
MGIRLILDTNLWSYVAEGGEAEALEALEDDLGLKVVIPPSMLLEVLATPREDVRARIVGVIAKPRRSRIHPLPEARLEADEITAVIRRLRPEWVRQLPRTDRISNLETFWTKQIWQKALEDAARIAAIDAGAGSSRAIQVVLSTCESGPADGTERPASMPTRRRPPLCRLSNRRSVVRTRRAVDGRRRRRTRRASEGLR